MQSIRECGIYKAGQLLQQQLASECVVLPAKRGVAKHPNFAKQNMCESSRAQRHKQHSVTVAKELPCPYASCSTERRDCTRSYSVTKKLPCLVHPVVLSVEIAPSPLCSVTRRMQRHPCANIYIFFHLLDNMQKIIPPV